MGSYFPDESLFVFDAIPPRQYVGAKAYRKDLEDFFASFPGPVETFEIADLNVVTNGNLGFSHSIQRSVFTDKDGKKLDITLRVTDAYRKVNGTGNDIQAPRHFTKGAPGAKASVTIDRFCSALQYRRRSAQLGSSHRLCTAANQSRALTPEKKSRARLAPIATRNACQPGISLRFGCLSCLAETRKKAAKYRD